MISTKLAYRVSLCGAAVILLLLVVSAFQQPMVTCGGLAKGYAPVVALELARSIGDVQQIFGAGASGCRTTLVNQIFVGTWIDCLALIPAYGTFLLFFFLAMVPRDDRSALVGFILSAFAVVAGFVENICLFQIMAAPDTAGFSLAVLPFATGLKWLALGLAGAV